MKETIAIIAAFIAIIGNVPYIRAVLKGTVKPHPYTWLVGSIVSCVIFFGQVVKGAGIGALPTAASEIFTVIIFILSIRYGFKGITKSDTIFLILALLGIIPWVLTKDPTLSVIIAVGIDVIALLPTMRKTWSNPSTEKPILYAMNVLRHALSLFSLQAYNIATALHSCVMVIVNTVITLIIYRKKFTTITNEEGSEGTKIDPVVASYSGQFGIVLLLEDSLRSEVLQKSKTFAQGNAIHFEQQHIPHVTLYHSKFKNLPKEVVQETLLGIAKKLPCALPFTKTESFWDKFIFWNIEKTAELTALHEQSLFVAAYFNAEGPQQSDSEKVILSEAEEQAVRIYGNPLVGALWRPHVTLGYFPEGIVEGTKSAPFEGRSVAVAFVRIGEYGTVVEILAQKRL